MPDYTPSLARLLEALDIYDVLTDEVAAAILDTTLTGARRSMSRLVAAGAALFVPPDPSFRTAGTTTHPGRHQGYALVASPTMVGTQPLTVLDVTATPVGTSHIAVFDPYLRDTRITRIPCRPSHAEVDHLALLLSRAKNYERVLGNVKVPNQEKITGRHDALRAAVILPRDDQRYGYALRDRSLPPLLAVNEEEAILYALRYNAALVDCHSLFYIKAGDGGQRPALLYATRRGFAGAWHCDPALGADLLRVWEHTKGDLRPMIQAATRRQPQAVVVEIDDGAQRDLASTIEQIIDCLPRNMVRLVLPHQTGAPTLARSGAARLLRHRRLRPLANTILA